MNIYIPAFVLTLLGFVLAFQFVDPAPPTTLTFSGGQPGGAYASHAKSYRDYFQQRGIKLEILTSAGSMQNIERLKLGQADVAFVQSGMTQTDDQLLSLGSMYYEPLWVFLRADVNIQFLRDLKGKRIAIGLPGSGTRALALGLLKDNGIDEHSASLLSISADQAAKSLIHSNIDAVFIVSSAQSEIVKALQKNTALQLMPMRRAAAYQRRMASMSSVLLPQGALNLGLNIPPEDTPLLANTATLMINASLHPALQALMMQAAVEIHAGGSLFAEAGAFPTALYAAQPLSQVADRFYQSGPPFLQRFLPFWAATLVDRLKLMLLPFIALLLPLIKIMPPLYRWRIRSRIYRWYDELNRIDTALADGFKASLLDDLNRIESEIRKVHVPLAYTEELYDLRMHVALVRKAAERTKTIPLV